MRSHGNGDVILVRKDWRKHEGVMTVYIRFLNCSFGLMQVSTYCFFFFLIRWVNTKLIPANQVCHMEGFEVSGGLRCNC